MIVKEKERKQRLRMPKQQKNRKTGKQKYAYGFQCNLQIQINPPKNRDIPAYDSNSGSDFVQKWCGRRHSRCTHGADSDRDCVPRVKNSAKKTRINSACGFQGISRAKQILIPGTTLYHRAFHGHSKFGIRPSDNPVKQKP